MKFIAIHFKQILVIVFSFYLLVTGNAQDMSFDDQEVTNMVQQQLVGHSHTPAYLIDVSSMDGIVTLSGEISNALAKEQAAKVAMTVKGVRGVVNQIEINAPKTEDSEIEELVNQALAEDPATEAYQVETKVVDGNVMLSGEVNSYQEKKLAAYVAKGVVGVNEVTNNIIVDYTIERTDEEIKEEVKSLLQNDVRIDTALIDVQVNNGKVDLTGVVGSLAEKYQAEANAWVAGVTDVNVKELETKRWARDEDLRVNKYTNRTDIEIREAVLDVLAYDPRLNTFALDVEVDDGEVILTGTVNNLKAKKVATNDVKNVVGVFAVKNYLKVRPENIPQNPDLMEEVEQAIIRDPYIDRTRVEIEADHGVIYLNGAVRTYFDKYHAEDVISRVEGVVAVENGMVVGEKEDYYDFDYNAFDTYETLPYVDVDEETRKSDWEIRKDIKNELFWSPYVNEDEVDITVTNGRVVLTGTVDTSREKTYAEINALEGGAIAVENDLKVAFGPTSADN